MSIIHTMQKMFSTALCTCAIPFVGLYAQVSNKPVTSMTQVPAAVNAPAAIPVAYPSSMPLNYVRTKDALGPYTSLTAFDAAGYANVKQTTQYLDGLGRPLQTVMRQATPGTDPKDMISPVAYDEFGREQFKYMGYVSNSNTGDFKADPFTEQNNFLQTQYPGEQVFYSRTEFEPSPLNRPVRTFAPGNSWGGSNDKYIAQKYLINSVADDVRIWTISDDGNFDNNIPLTSAAYDAGELYKTVTLDENDKAIVEYKDKEGKVILKKVQEGTVPADFSGYTGWLCTYYIYDDLERLRFVLSPKATAAINNPIDNWSVSSDISNELCFRSEYDYRNRMIAQKVPGAGWVYMVYDKRDRLVYTQDANMRAKGWWLTTLYDDLGRPVMKGMLTNYTGTRAQLQDYVNDHFGLGASTVTAQRTNTASIARDIFINTNQTGTHIFQATDGIRLDEGFGTDDNADITLEIASQPTGTSINEGVAVNNSPLPDDASFIALTLTYYDNYGFNTDPAKAYNTGNNSKLDDGGNLHAVTLPNATEQAAVSVKDMVTGSRVRTLPDANDLSAGNFLTTV